MPTLAERSYSHAFKGRPDRMSPEDFAIWQRWFPTFRHNINRMYFDVGLGDGLPAPFNAPPQYAKAWLRNTQKRADAILDTLNDLILIELRFDANANAIGRLMTYQLLYAKDPIFGPITRTMLITNTYYDHMDELCKQVKIEYIVT